MKFKLILAFVDERATEKVLRAVRKLGATGATLIPTARGEGLEIAKGIFGLTVGTRRDVLLFLVEQHMSRGILEKICEVGEFERKSGAGIALQLDVEDVVGQSSQVDKLARELDAKI